MRKKAACLRVSVSEEPIVGMNAAWAKEFDQSISEYLPI